MLNLSDQVKYYHSEKDFMLIERHTMISKKVPCKNRIEFYHVSIGLNRFCRYFIGHFVLKILKSATIIVIMISIQMKIKIDPMPSMKFNVSQPSFSNPSDHGSVGVNLKSMCSVIWKKSNDATSTITLNVQIEFAGSQTFAKGRCAST